MPKDTSAARRQDSRILEAVDGIGHRDALLRLDGSSDSADTARAIHTVTTIKAAVRARQATHHDKQSVALAKVLRARTAELADELFPVVVAEEVQRWQLLIGCHVTFERHTEDYTQYLTGVVLGIDQTEKGPALRVALTVPALGKRAGEVVSIAAQYWQTDPTPAQVAATASRETHCAEGRPVYAPSELPEGIFASLPDLTQRRLRPAVLQAPVATLRRDSRAPTALYAVADAEVIPAVGRSAAAVTRRRTCTTCGASSATPFRAASDRRRYCSEHVDAASQRLSDAEKRRDRAVCAVWARHVLDDPAMVLVVMLSAKHGDFSILVEDLAGAVLLDESMVDTPIPGLYTSVGVASSSFELPAWVYSAQAHALQNRRAIVTASEGGAIHYRNMTRSEAVKGDPFTICEREGDSLPQRRRIWTGDTDLTGVFDGDQAFDSRLWHLRTERGAQIDPAALVGKMRRELDAMASTELTADQRVYAENLVHDRRAPEQAPYFTPRRHKTMKRIAEVLELFGE
jgi:hypothetical protein